MKMKQLKSLKKIMPESSNKLKNSITEKLTINADFSFLESVRKVVYDSAVKFGFSDDVSHLISLSVDEACTNLIRYAYNFDTKKKIEISISNTGNEFIVQILDNGNPFDPMEVNAPDMNKYFEEFRRGGLGIFIIRQAMDIVQYTPSNSKNKKNILRLIKKLV